MKVIVTGMNGTVAPVLAGVLREAGCAVAAWDRSRVAVDDVDAMRAFFDRERPAWICHVATGPEAWAEAIAGECAVRGIGLMYTSSVSVFAESRRGPIGVDETPDATDDYGRYKAECERRIRRVCPGALIARLGWQIGDGPGSNNMVEHLNRGADDAGRITASRRWTPSCAFLEDTAEAIWELMDGAAPAGTYHLEGNPGLSMYEIAVALDMPHGGRWTIEPVDEPVRDNRMVDERVRVRVITERLGG